MFGIVFDFNLNLRIVYRKLCTKYEFFKEWNRERILVSLDSWSFMELGEYLDFFFKLVKLG